MSPDQDRFAASRSLHARACNSLAGGVSTAFRALERPVPLFLKEAQGARLVDVDGNEYVDFVCGFGPVILGHNDETVTEAVARGAGSLQQVGGQQAAEIELAETLCKCVPAFQLVRFSSSGSEAVHAALRLARAATGRPLVVKFAGHYHGWLDNVYAGTFHAPPVLPESRGQTPSALSELVVIDWNDEAGLRSLFATAGDQIAGVIMEPIACNGGVIYPADGYLELARDLTAATGAVLIFDEVITGFRLGLGGAQAEVDVTPDLAIVAKAMANGLPISAFGGRRDLMELVAHNTVTHAGTYNGGGASIAAALATIDELERESGRLYRAMSSHASRLMDGLRQSAQRHGHRLVVQGPGPVFFAWFLDQDEVTSHRDHLRADIGRYARFAELMLGLGVRLIPSGRWYLTASHTVDDIERALVAADHAFRLLES